MAESIFTGQTPTSADVSEPGGINTAVTFVTAVDGTVTGIRFFAPLTVSGTFTGELYQPTTDDDPAGSGAGTLLGSGTLAAASVTAGAWNVIPLSSPVPVTAGIPYRANRHSSNGRYVATSGAFASDGITNGNLTAPANGTNSGGLGSLWNGTFRTGAAPAYPSDAFGGGNYFVDVVFEPLASPGQGEADLPFVVTLAAVGETPVPTGGSAAFTLALAGAATGEAADPNATGVCGWSIDPEALGVCEGWGAKSAPVRSAALEMAALYLWAATGRQYGVCPTTIRPVQGGLRTEDLYQDYALVPGHADSSGAYLFAGRWYNTGCGTGCCGTGGCAVTLRGPVASVISVVVGGEVLSAGTYRVDVTGGEYLLIRTDGSCWPTCAHEPGDFEVTYGLGRELPVALQLAAALLACEYAKYFAGGACALPARMTRLSRQGVEVEVDTGSPSEGTTGIRQVDDVIAALNPNGRKSPPVLLSPDLPGGCDRFTVI